MQDKDNNLSNNMFEEDGFSVKRIISYAFAYWKLILASLVLCLVVAFVYLRISVPKYQVMAKILLQDTEKGTFMSQADMLADFGFQAQNTNVENEIEVINSVSVVRGAVADAELYVSYSLPGFENRPIYKNESPLKVTCGVDSNGNFCIDSLSRLNREINIHFSFNGAGSIKAEYECYVNSDDEEPTEFKVEFTDSVHLIKTPVGGMLVEKRTGFEEYTGELLVTVSPLDAAARHYMAHLNVAPISKTSSVSVMTFNTAVPRDGVDFLNAVIESYNFVTNEEKREVARQTEEFIIERIDSLSKELLVMETRLSTYKKNNQLIAPELDAAVVSKNKTEYTKQLEEVDLMLNSSQFLRGFINDADNEMKVVPTTFGLTVDPALLAIINNYNQEVIAYNRLALTAKGGNPALKKATSRVNQLQDDLRVAIDAFDRSLRMQRDAIATLLENYTDRYEQSPDIERELITIERECKIKSGLYVMLLQKYEENALTLAVASNNLRCIDSPIVVGRVAPNSRMILLVALFVGLLIPVAFIYIREMMRTTLTINDDIAELTDVPVVGTIPLNRNINNVGTRALVVARNVNDLMAEAFRTLRTNLQFVMKNSAGKVVMFTSTTSGEGKTFVAANLAMSVAILGKKVLLVGLDVRRPRLAEMFGFDKEAEGITSYLASDAENTSMLDGFIKPSGIDDNLFVLPAGIVPPNPSELLARPNLDRAVEYLSDKFDYIVLDTAPVALVTDSIIISRVADAVTYVLRYDYTQKADIRYMNSIVSEGKLNGVSVVLNADDLKKKMYGYVSERRGSNKYTGYGYYNDGRKNG